MVVNIFRWSSPVDQLKMMRLETLGAQGMLSGETGSDTHRLRQDSNPYGKSSVATSPCNTLHTTSSFQPAKGAYKLISMQMTNWNSKLPRKTNLFYLFQYSLGSLQLFVSEGDFKTVRIIVLLSMSRWIPRITNGLRLPSNLFRISKISHHFNYFVHFYIWAENLNNTASKIVYNFQNVSSVYNLRQLTVDIWMSQCWHWLSFVLP